jgi:hypothetical protein
LKLFDKYPCVNFRRVNKDDELNSFELAGKENHLWLKNQLCGDIPLLMFERVPKDLPTWSQVITFRPRNIRLNDHHHFVKLQENYFYSAIVLIALFTGLKDSL